MTSMLVFCILKTIQRSDLISTILYLIYIDLKNLKLVPIIYINQISIISNQTRLAFAHLNCTSRWYNFLKTSSRVGVRLHTEMSLRMVLVLQLLLTNASSINHTTDHAIDYWQPLSTTMFQCLTATFN